jgi:hypothetical protein
VRDGVPHCHQRQDDNTAAAFAQALGATPNAYGMVEAGSSLSTDMTRRIVELVPGISMDWLHTGNERFLTVEMRQPLRRVADGQLQGVTSHHHRHG